MNLPNSKNSPPKSFFDNNLALRHKMTGRRVLIAVVVAGLTIGVVGLVNRHARSLPVETSVGRALPVATMLIQAVEDHEVERYYTGQIVARRETTLAFQRQGKLIAIHVDDGDRVRKGDALAILDLRRLQARQQELQARLCGATAQLDEMLAGPRRETIDAMRARVESQAAAVKELQQQKTRRELLLQKNAVSREDFENTSLRLEAAQAGHDEITHQLTALLNGTRTEQIESQEAVVAQLDALITDLKVEIDDSTITAPFDGTIAARLIDDGAVVTPNTPVLRLIEDQVLEARIGVPTEAAEAIVSGATHNLIVNQRSYHADNVKLLPKLDPTTRTQTAVFQLSFATAQELVPGQLVRLELTKTVSQGGFWVPHTALLESQRGLWSVYVVGRETAAGLTTARRQDVEALHTDSDRVLVRGTLRTGDQIITSGVHRIVPGQAIVPSTSDTALR